MEFYTKTDIGKVRKTNQDAVKIKSLDDNFIWSVVCDGMGGTYGGNIASTTAVNEITNHLNFYLYQNDSKEKIKDIMYNAIYTANTAIFKKAIKSRFFKNMGTTVVLCIIYDKVLHIVYAGDSRVYLIRNSEIKQLSKDHSIVQEMVDSGEITERDARNHPHKNIITKALGVRANIEPDYSKSQLQKDDIILCCTDGLTNHLNELDILRICSTNDFSDVTNKLIKETNNLGGVDNITVSLVKI